MPRQPADDRRPGRGQRADRRPGRPGPIPRGPRRAAGRRAGPGADLAAGRPRRAGSNSKASSAASWASTPRPSRRFLQALSLGASALGKEHPDYARTLHELGRLYEELGQYAGAERLFRSAMGIREQTLGKHADLAQSLHDLGGLCDLTARHAEAEAFYLRSRADAPRPARRRRPRLRPEPRHPGVDLVAARPAPRRREPGPPRRGHPPQEPRRGPPRIRHRRTAPVALPPAPGPPRRGRAPRPARPRGARRGAGRAAPPLRRGAGEPRPDPRRPGPARRGAAASPTRASPSPAPPWASATRTSPTASPRWPTPTRPSAATPTPRSSTRRRWRSTAPRWATRHPHVAGCLRDLGEVCAAQERFAEAEEHYRKAVDLLQPHGSACALELIETLQGLARVVAAQNRPDEADRLGQQAVEQARQLAADRRPRSRATTAAPCSPPASTGWPASTRSRAGSPRPSR